MRVTFDAVMYISALEFRGVPKEALAHAVRGGVLLTCNELEHEIIRVMRDKFYRSATEMRNLLSALLSDAATVAIAGKLTGVCRDPNDDY